MVICSFTPPVQPPAPVSTGLARARLFFEARLVHLVVYARHHIQVVLQQLELVLFSALVQVDLIQDPNFGNRTSGRCNHVRDLDDKQLLEARIHLHAVIQKCIIAGFGVGFFTSRFMAGSMVRWKAKYSSKCCTKSQK